MSQRVIREREWLFVLVGGVEIEEGALRRAKDVLKNGAGVVGGCVLRGGRREFGLMLAPARFGPLLCEYVAVASADRGSGIDGLMRSEIDVAAYGFLATRCDLFGGLGGFDRHLSPRGAWADYCMKVKRRGYVVRCEPEIEFARKEGAQSRHDQHDLRILGERYGGDGRRHADPPNLRARSLRREVRYGGGVRDFKRVTIPRTTVLLHGKAAASQRDVERSIGATAMPIERIVWLCDHPVAAAAAEMERRGDRYVAIVDAGRPPANGWLDALIEQVEWGYDVAAAADGRGARCVLISCGKVPAHHRLQGAEVNRAVDRFLGEARAFGRATRYLDGSIPEELPVTVARPARTCVIAVCVSEDQATHRTAFGALHTTRVNGEELIAVVAAGAKQTVAHLRTFPEMRVVVDDSDSGLARGVNRAIAMTQADRIAIVADDNLLSPGWLGALHGGFDYLPVAGIVAPCAAGIAGAQGIYDAAYDDLVAMRRYANRRAAARAGEFRLVESLSATLLCVRCEVIAAIGGFDETLGISRYGTVDFCVRAAQAGYQIAVSEEVFAHHFPPEIAKPTAVLSTKTGDGWSTFRRKWQLGAAASPDAYGMDALRRRGFDRARHYVPLPRDVLVLAVASDEATWERVAAATTRFVDMHGPGDGCSLAIGARGRMSVAEAAARVKDLVARSARGLEHSAQIYVGDANDVTAWLSRLPAVARTVAVGDELPELQQLT